MSNDEFGLPTTILRKASTIRATAATGELQFSVAGNGDVWMNPQGALVGSSGFTFSAQDGTGGIYLSPYSGVTNVGTPRNQYESDYGLYNSPSGAPNLTMRFHPIVGSNIAGVQIGQYSGGGLTVPMNDAYLVMTGWQNNLVLATSGGFGSTTMYAPSPFGGGDSVINTTNVKYYGNDQTDRLYFCDWFGSAAYLGGFNDGSVFSWYEGYLRGLKIGFKASASGDAIARLDVNVDNAHPTHPITAGVSITGTYNIVNTSGFISSLIGTTNIRPKGTGLAVAPTFFNSTGPHYGEYIAPVANNASALTYGLFVTMQGATQGNLSAYSGVFIGQGFGINTALPGSSMTIVGSVSMSQVAKSSNYTLTGTDRIVFGNAASAPVYLTLPSSTNISGRTYTVKKTDATANAVVVGTAVGNSLDGVTASFLTSQYAKATFVSDNGNNWYTV